MRSRLVGDSWVIARLLGTLRQVVSDPRSDAPVTDAVPRESLDAVREEFKENEDLPNTTNPDDWAKIAGKKGERIVYVKSLVGQASQPRRDVEKLVTTGQYL